jgi:hypothetical protein
VQDAQQERAPSVALRYDVRREDGSYRILNGAAAPSVEFGVEAAYHHLYKACYAKATEALPQSSVFLHAACGSYAGRRFLLIGHSGVGKTTLIVRIAHEGGLVESDDLVVLQPDGVIGLPRRFNLKEGSLALLPWIAAGLDRMPSFGGVYGPRVYSFAPSEWGYPWQIRSGPIDAVFYLEPNHGGQPRITELPRYQMAQLAIGEARVFNREHRGWMSELCRLLDQASCCKLVVGGLDSTAALLLKRIAGLPAGGGAANGIGGTA